MGCCDGRWGGCLCSWYLFTAHGYGKGGHMWVNSVRDLEGVHGTVNVFDLEWARLLDRPDFSKKTMGCCDRRWGGCLCSWCFSTVHGYGKGGHMWVNGSIDLKGVHVTVNTFDSERAKLLDRPDFSKTVGCCDGRWGGCLCSWCFSAIYGYGKGGQMVTVNLFDLEWARLAARLPRFQQTMGCCDGRWEVAISYTGSTQSGQTRIPVDQGLISVSWG